MRLPDGSSELARLADWVRSVAPGCEGPVRLARLGKGQSNLTFLATDAQGRSWVVRRPPFGHTLASAHDVGRERTVLEALASSKVPVPAVLAFSDDAAMVDAPTMLVEHVPGTVVDSLETAESLSLETRRTVGLNLVGGLVALHQADVEAVGLADFASHSSYAARQVRRWSRQWEATAYDELPLMSDLAARLGRRLPARETLAVVHGDYHLRNAIVSAEDGSLLSVLDWELSTLGDPLADLGSMLGYWPEAGDGPTPMFAASALPGFPSRQELVETYAAASGADLEGLDFWRALGLWKVAVIVAGVVVRQRDTRNAAEGAPSDDAVAQLAAAADDCARAGGI